MQKRKVKIRITTASRQIFRLGGQSLRAFCAACGREVELVTRGQASAILEIVDVELIEFIAAGRVHTIRTVSGSIRVCKDSLF